MRISISAFVPICALVLVLLLVSQVPLEAAEPLTKLLFTKGTGVTVGKVKYMQAETIPDLGLEHALRKTGFCSGASARSKIRYCYNKIDLNDDGKPEFVVIMLGPSCCGSGGCPGFVFSSAANGYRILAYVPLVDGPIIVSDHKTRGWKDLIRSVAGHRQAPHYCIRPWNGGYYPISSVITMKKGEKINGTALLADDIALQTGIALEPSNSESEWNEHLILVRQQMNRRQFEDAVDSLKRMLSQSVVTKNKEREAQVSDELSKAETAVSQAANHASANQSQNIGHAFMRLAGCFGRLNKYDVFQRCAEKSWQLLRPQGKGLETWKAVLLEGALYYTMEDRDGVDAKDIIAHCLPQCEKAEKLLDLQPDSGSEKETLATECAELAKYAALLGDFDTYQHCAEMAWSLHPVLTRNAYGARIIDQAAASAVMLDGDIDTAQELLKHLPILDENNSEEQLMKKWAEQLQAQIESRTKEQK